MNTNDSHLTWEQPALEGKMEVTDEMVRTYMRGTQPAITPTADPESVYFNEVRRGLKAVLGLPQFSQSYTEETKRTADAIIEHFNAHKPLATNRELDLLRLICDQAMALRGAGGALRDAVAGLKAIAARPINGPSSKIAQGTLEGIGPMIAL